MEEKELETKVDEVVEESDFADEVKPIEKPEDKPVEEPKSEAESVNMYNEDVEVDPDYASGANNPYKKKTKGPEPAFEYEHESLKKAEEARQVFHKKYKKAGIVKWILTAVALVGIILGYVLPTFTGSEEWRKSNGPTYVMLGILVAMIIALALFSFLSRRINNKGISEYLDKYYVLSNEYVFDGLNLADLSGSLADKIETADLTACALYSRVDRVGSRGLLHFEYNNVPCSLVDCSASVAVGRNMSTVFVGKMLRAENTWDADDVIVYIKGNKRALPPTNLEGYQVVEDKKDHVIYGLSKKKLLPQKTREAIAKIRTDKTLVDCAIAIRKGTTYIMMGYEDSLMVPPLEHPLNPAPLSKYKEDLKVVLEVAETLYR